MVDGIMVEVSENDNIEDHRTSLLKEIQTAASSTVAAAKRVIVPMWKQLISKVKEQMAAGNVRRQKVFLAVFLLVFFIGCFNLPSGRHSVPKFNVNEPPVTLPAGQTLDSLQVERKEEVIVVDPPQTSPPTHQAVETIPIVNHNDDKLPPGAGVGRKKAADALECRASVVNFVVNATDNKDECLGLEKAFDTTCNADDSMDEFQSITGDGGGGGSQRSRRQLSLLEDHQRVNNWTVFLYRHVLWLKRSLLKLFYTQPLFMFAEDEVENAWDEAKYQVENDLDFALYDNLRKELAIKARERRQQEQQRRRLEASDEMENGTVTPVKHQPIHMPLDLPTARKELKAATLEETLVLQQENKVIETVMKATQNQTLTNSTMNSAQKDAAASSKAVSEATAVISAVLNDPTSVEARTCCSSILNVYHQKCKADAEDDISDKRLFIGVFIMALCGVVKSLIRHFQIRWLPEAAGCILVGVLGGFMTSFFPQQHEISFDGHWFLRIMVPPIVFEAALSIDKRSFHKHVLPIFFYAVFGTLMSSFLTAYIVYYGTDLLGSWCEPIPFIESLMFGALISSIDPIAVLGVMSNLGLTDTDAIYVLIFGESLLNDGVAMVLFDTLMQFLDTKVLIDENAIFSAMLQFCIIGVGSISIGCMSGVLCTVYQWAMQGCQTSLVEVLMFSCGALIPYYISDGVGWSGIVSAVAAGVVMDIYIVGQTGIDIQTERGRRRLFSGEGLLSLEARTHIGFVTEILATTMETAIFAYLGLFLFSNRYHWNFWHTLVAIYACCLSRAVMIPFLSTAVNLINAMRRPHGSCRSLNDFLGSGKSGGASDIMIDHRMQLVLWMAGLRGAISFALVENMPLFDGVTGEGTRLKAELKAMTSGTILFTVFVMGGSTHYVMEYLGLSPAGKLQASESDMVELLNDESMDENVIELEDTTIPAQTSLFPMSRKRHIRKSDAS